jgi:hypothetical protein
LTIKFFSVNLAETDFKIDLGMVELVAWLYELNIAVYFLLYVFQKRIEMRLYTS